jgi:hypothetical protein
MKYFEQFPTINYPYVGHLVPSIDGTKSQCNVVDLTVRFKVVEGLLRNPLAYYNYYWREGMRLDILARDYYGDANLSWVVMMSASIYDWLYDLPLDEDAFIRYLQEKYSIEDVYALGNTVHHYETGSGHVIDSLTYSTLPDPDKRAVSVYDYEESINESKRNIKLISKAFLPKVLGQFETSMNEIKSIRSES